MSVFRQVAGEAILLAGGGRAILLQIANPVVGYGVAAHSDFANRPLDRFTNTVTYTYTTVFGSSAERAEVIRRVNRAHGPVHSPRTATHPAHPDPSPVAAGRRTAEGEGQGGSSDRDGGRLSAAGGGGEPVYDAFDRSAQLWVAATLYQTAVQVYEKAFGTLSREGAQEVFEGFAVLGTALQVPDDAWPASVGAFDDYWRGALAGLQVTDEARRVAHDLLHPHTAPLWLRAAMPLVRLLSAGLLPAELRRAFVLPWSRGRQRAFDTVFAVTAAVYPRLPLWVRHLPRDYYLRQLRASISGTPTRHHSTPDTP